MKFKIRYADKIVGFFSIAAIIGVIVLIFAIGAGQNWFAKKLNFYTIFESGNGLSVGLELKYKGFTIGKVKAIKLEQNRVRVDYYILADYANYALENSLVQLITSPIGLGSEFIFHPGVGPQHLEDNTEIFNFDSREGRQLLMSRKNRAESRSDSIGALMNKASTLIDSVNIVVMQLSAGLRGRENSKLGDILKNVEEVTRHIAVITDSVKTIDNIVPRALGTSINREINTILGNINDLSQNLNKTVQGADSELTDLLAELDALMLQVEDVLTGVKNNPLIKGGIPDRSQSAPGTFHTRDEEF